MSDPGSLLWIVILGGIAMFIMAFGIGANDVANAFGTAVGAKVLTHRQAVCVAAVCEFLGAFLAGSAVTETVRKGILEVGLYDDEPDILMVGMFCALVAAGIWLLIATFFKLPVSTTHTIVGAIVGFGLVSKGLRGVNWIAIGFIVLSWVTSPVASGIISILFFLFARHAILRRKNPERKALIFLPFFYAFTFFVIIFFIMFKGTPGLEFTKVTLVEGVIIAAVAAGIALVVSAVVVVPMAYRYVQIGAENWNGLTWAKKFQAIFACRNVQPDIEMIEKKKNKEEEENQRYKEKLQTRSEKMKEKKFFQKIFDTSEEEMKISNNAEVFKPEAEAVFSFLQILTVAFDSFAHGSNDVANAVGPFAAIYAIFVTEEANPSSAVPWWVLLIGAGGIVVGLGVLGYRVMKTIGRRISTITPTRGFTIEIGSALVVVGASQLGMPVSTTHSQVGSVVGVGLADGPKAINWKLILHIVLSWVFTLPFACGLSALLFAVLQFTV